MTLTRFPGTMVYMPPEALYDRGHSVYGPSLESSLSECCNCLHSHKYVCYRYIPLTFSAACRFPLGVISICGIVCVGSPLWLILSAEFMSTCCLSADGMIVTHVLSFSPYTLHAVITSVMTCSSTPGVSRRSHCPHVQQPRPPPGSLSV